MHGKDIVQTTTRKRPWQHGVARKSVGEIRTSSNLNQDGLGLRILTE